MIKMPEILLDTLWRFWSKVDKQSDSECWNWVGNIVGKGYGQITINCRGYYVHRISYYIYHKEDPSKLLVCHECNNKLCVNPQHLFLGTDSDNLQHAFDTNSRSNQGVLNPMSRFTAKGIHDIRIMSKIKSNAYIAKIYAVDPSTIWAIISGKTWKHVS